MRKDIPTPAMLHKLLRCESDTGKLFWRERPVSMFADGGGRYTPERNAKVWNSKWAGTEAFTSTAAQGYMVGGIFYRKYYAHRVIWAMVHGEWPADEIDHINGVRDDNRLDNLRAVSSLENSRNSKIPSGSTSGVIGVSWDTRCNKWVAQIQAHGKNIHLGTFTSKPDAIAARAAAEIKHGYHANHGRIGNI